MTNRGPRGEFKSPLGHHQKPQLIWGFLLLRLLAGQLAPSQTLRTPTVSRGAYCALMNDSTQKPTPRQRSARPETAQGSAPPERSGADAKKSGIALYHDMRVEEDFAKCATRLFSILKRVAATSPGAPRYLYLDIQGHRNAAGGYDADAIEIIHEFLLGFLSPYLTEISTPVYRARNPEPQREDVPDVLTIRDPDREHAYDHRELRVRNRDSRPDPRRSRPPVRAIADYLGLDEPICLICWQTPVERAHVVPESLGGSNDVRNFALLCPHHHREAPDVADAEAFWSWVDYACERDGHMKWEGAEPQMLATAERRRPLGRADGGVPHGDGCGDQYPLQCRQEGIHLGMGLRSGSQTPARRGDGA